MDAQGWGGVKTRTHRDTFIKETDPEILKVGIFSLTV